MDLPLPTCIGALYNNNPQEYLPSEKNIHFWTHEGDEETVHRMLDLPEDAEEAKKLFWLCEGIIKPYHG